MKLLLQHKIVAGYLLLMAVIGCMVAIVLHERNRVRKIEDESIAIFQTQHHINTAHRYVTTLLTYGESVIVWNKEDSLSYRERRTRTDSLLQILSIRCRDFIHPDQIDSLCALLATKEKHLFQLMEAFQKIGNEPQAKLRAAKLRAMFNNTQDYKSHKPCTCVDLLVEELEHPENLLNRI